MTYGTWIVVPLFMAALRWIEKEQDKMNLL